MLNVIYFVHLNVQYSNFFFVIGCHCALDYIEYLKILWQNQSAYEIYLAHIQLYFIKLYNFLEQIHCCGFAVVSVLQLFE